MRQAPTRVIADGRVTIPAAVRNELEIEQGDYVVVEVEPWGGDT
ncbi:AbrB/MazE/SpoVT family DNA-binding domain-containing protein [Haloarcula pellucida]|nr:AbrB/MazE/SpoVT family DNA-binding domain-containing protein [Halomicroarcula pellucida]